MRSLLAFTRSMLIAMITTAPYGFCCVCQPASLAHLDRHRARRWLSLDRSTVSTLTVIPLALLQGLDLQGGMRVDRALLGSYLSGINTCRSSKLGPRISREPPALRNL